MVKISKISLGLVVVAVIAAGAAFWVIHGRYTPATIPALRGPNANNKNAANQNRPINSNSQSPTLPAVFSLNVPFTSQAPTSNWDELHGEACEEASAIMAHAYFSGKTEPKLDASYVESELSKLTDWEKKTYGYYLDIDSHETAKMIEDVYGLKTRIIEDYSEDDIKKELVAGNLVILSFNGKQLGNPNFRNGGPVYHMLVVRGYNTQGFVTNDPGTRNGMNYSYSWDTLYNAAGEWQHDTRKTDQSIKLAIVVSK
jgi:hypothetical protein